MTDLLIRDVPEDVLVAIDANAKPLGLSRSVYLRRMLAAAAASGQHFSAGDLADKSALARLADSPHGQVWAESIERGLV